MEGTSKDLTWPYLFPNIRDENNSKWTEVEKKLNDPRFQAATARVFGERRPVKPCVRSALKRRFDLENSQATRLHHDGSPHKKSRLASIASTSSESEQGSTSPCDSTCGCNSQSNGLANEWESLCKRILSIREKLQSVPEMNTSFDQRVRELSDKARCTYDWLQNVIPPSRSHSENSYDFQDPDASCSDSDLNQSFECHHTSDKSETSVVDEQDQTMLKNLVSPTYAKNVENIAVFGKKVLITLRESPQKMSSPSLSATQINESSSEQYSNLKSLTVPVSKLPDYITDYDSYKSNMSSPTQNLSQVSLSNHEAENLTDANLKESCLSFSNNLTNYVSCDPVEELSMNPSASCDNVNEIIPQIKLEEISDRETEEASSEAESPEISDDTNSVQSDSSESEESTESDSQILDTSTYSSDSEEECITMLSDDEVSSSCKEFIATLRSGKCRDNSESDLLKTVPHTDSDTSDSEASMTFYKGSPCSEPPKRSAVPYSNSSLMPDLMTYVVTSVPVLSLNNSELRNHKSNSSFKKKRDEFQEIRSQVKLCKRALVLILKEQLCKEVKVVVQRLPDYIYKAHLQSKPIMLKNISPLISRVKSLNIL